MNQPGGLKNKNLTFALNFPCWGAGEIQLADLKSQIDSYGEGFEDRFLTLASQLQDDSEWQKLVKELEPNQSGP